MVYVATHGGLSISSDGGSTFTNRTMANGLGSNKVYDAYADGNTVYAATEGGLSISLDGGVTFTNYTTSDGLGGNIVNGVITDSSGGIYAATSGGLSLRASAVSQLPEIDITGAGASIPDDDTSPSTSDDTDFDNVLVGAETKDVTFTIINRGAGDLELTSTPIINISGTNADNFTVSTPPLKSTLANGETTTFIITFDPDATGLRTATVSIANDDSDENPYNFDIQGTGTVAPEIDISGNAVSISDGDSTPSTADNTNFGPVKVSSGTNASTFTVRNIGTDTLNLGSLSLSGTNSSDFSITSALSSSVIPAGGTATFTITFDPSDTGIRTATISLANDDSDENPYTFAIQGTGDATAPQTASTSPSNGEILTSNPQELTVSFNEDVKNDGSNGAANNVINYLLVEAGLNEVFDTTSCAVPGGNATAPDDIKVTIAGALYTSTGFRATLTLDSPLPNGTYRLFVCGTTSIEDLAGNELNDGLSDTTIDFTVQATASSLPDTGFRHGEVTQLPKQPAAKAYTETAMMLEIPKLGVSMPIVGVPQSESGWDVTWLGNSAGYLAGSAFPTWAGNTVITGHVWDAYNNPGIFAELKTLKYGDQVQIQAWGMTYIYEVRESKLVTVKNVNAAFQSSDYDWLTLVTCEFYNPFTGDYLFRRAVRAVLISVK